jgi:sRNA-binding carbon storage regulator CsrA
MPLIIGRSKDEGIVIVTPDGEQIVIEVDRIQKNYVKLAIIADRKFKIHRIERTNENRIYQQSPKWNDHPLLRPYGVRQDENDRNGTSADCPKHGQGTGESEAT